MTLQEAYRKGFRDAMCCFAVWNAGEQTIGVLRYPLAQALEYPEQFIYFVPPLADEPCSSDVGTRPADPGHDQDQDHEGEEG